MFLTILSYLIFRIENGHLNSKIINDKLKMEKSRKKKSTTNLVFLFLFVPLYFQNVFKWEHLEKKHYKAVIRIFCNIKYIFNVNSKKIFFF